jgi:hypothetical protein
MSESDDPLFKLVFLERVADYFEMTSYRRKKEAKGDTFHLYSSLYNLL